MNIHEIAARLLAPVMWLLPAAAAAQQYFGPLAMDGVELRCMVKYGMLDFENGTVMDKGLYAFDYADMFQPRKDSPLLRCNPSGGCVYHDGKLYVNEYDDTGQVHKQKPRWRVYDAKTYALLSDTELEDNCESTTTTLAYDPVSGNAYGFLSTFTEVFFVSVSMSTGEVTRIGSPLPYANKYLCMACTGSGQLYCIYFNKETDVYYLAKIRKTDGKVANVGEISTSGLMPGDTFMNGASAQALFVNSATGKMYWMYQSATYNLPRGEYTPIFEVDPVTAETVMKAYVADALSVTGAYFEEPAMTAPGAVTDICFDPASDDRLTGRLRFTLPARSYGGSPLSGPLRVSVSVDGGEPSAGTAAPGEAFATEPMTFGNGIRDVRITVSGSDGTEGVTVSRRFYAGYDVPAECKDITLAADGLTTTLTWKAPSDGQNGAPVRTDDCTYTVIRYPGEETVASGLKEMTFTETHPAELTRYVYKVWAVDGYGRKGRAAFSNNLIVGTPLDLPYGGMFTGAEDLFNYYTLVNANNDEGTWTYDSESHSAIYMFDYTNDADDWLISPPVNYRKGRQYVLRFNACSCNPDYPEAMEVRCGPGRTPESQSELLLYLPEVPYAGNPGMADEYSVTFTAPADSVYHFSFHAVSPAFSHILSVSNIRVEDAQPTGVGGIGLPAGRTVTVKAGDRAVRIGNPQGLDVTVCTPSGMPVTTSSGKVVNAVVQPGTYIISSREGTMKITVR